MKMKLPLFLGLLTVTFFHIASAHPLSNPVLKSPESASSYRQYCSHCHSGSAPSAPRLGDTKDWSVRLLSGFDYLYHSAIYGIPNTAMLAKGGHPELSDDQIKDLVGYMLISSKISFVTIEKALKYDGFLIADREFIHLDTNKNAFLEKKELQSENAFLKLFDEFDKNQDTRLSPVEFIDLRSSLELLRQTQNLTDEEIMNQVNATLANVKGMPPSGIRVNSKNGTLSIAGVVGSNTIIDLIWRSIRWIPGIKVIDNRLMTSEMLAFD